ncbi:DUF456 family protein [Gordonia sp. ABSL1-1]|uniref:DUF456 family protein n=1 Tax=Gordonia sp. ABSL1-1 TaxID=3053923 RepID=UPI00257365AF|nr:DUF456 family protein [Gordonia sp. ABSL1-1]MDL9938579.1 DUF456 family protein [Gordonia sp. ABSL1-1]
MPLYGELIVALAIGVGLLGIVIPVLPGSLVVGVAIGVWAAIVGGAGWAVFAAAAAVIVIGEVVKYFAAGRSLRAGGVPGTTIIVGGVVGIVGFFVVPVIGLFLGFLLGAAVTELIRTRHPRPAWRGAVAACKAAAITMGIELLAALLATAIWLAGAFVL